MEIIRLFDVVNIFQRKVKAFTEAVVRRYSAKKLFLKILQNSQENTCARASFEQTLLKKEILAHGFSCKFCKIFKNICYRIPPVAASAFSKISHDF